MRVHQASLLIALAMTLCACGRQGSAPTAAGPSAPAAASAATAPKVGSARDKSAPDSKEPLTLTRLNDDGSETVEEVPGDSGAHNQLLAAVASTVAAAATAATAAPVSSTAWQDGVNYTRLVPAQPTSVPAGQVEVLEFFWYACPHCYALDPLIATWEKSKPAYISFSRVPVLWNEGHRSLARLFYTLQSMGKLSQFHDDVFKEIHVNGNPLIGSDPNNAAQAERVQLVFIRKLGISEADFEKAYHSFEVEKSLQRADELVQRYRVTGVPTFVVNGKYIADLGTASLPSQTPIPERLITLLGDLAAQEHRH
jgi:protein dithiol oxidoreductase (disulfide-forming)